MERFKRFVSAMAEYHHVAEFQRLCGVEVVQGITAPDYTDHNGTHNGTHAGQNGEHQVHHAYDSYDSDSYTQHKGKCKNGVELTSPDDHDTEPAYKINNYFIFYLMQFGGGLGGTLFYVLFFSFMYWNVDCHLTRCVLLIWSPLMFAGQLLKDFIRWPRPGRPAIRLEGGRFDQEYGMPSTHTIVGTCIPFTLLVITSRYYEFPYIAGLTAAVLWAGLVACSRVYLGMHTVLGVTTIGIVSVGLTDCLAGISLTAAALPPMLAVVQEVDHALVTLPYAPLCSFLAPLLACIYYPQPQKWSITRGDTSSIVSTGALFMTSAWGMYQLGWMTELHRPRAGLKPLPGVSLDWFVGSALRMAIGMTGLVSFRLCTKKLFIALVCACAGVDIRDVARQRELGLEVAVRWLSVGGLAFIITFIMPLLFEYLGINRQGFFEIVTV